VDSAGLERYALIIAVAIAAFMVPWSVYAALSLPARATAEHWAMAWTGLDTAEAISAGLTALLIRLRRPQAALTATLSAGLLLTDAWFDICTAAPGFDQRIAVLAAGLLEIPLAVMALTYAWFSLTPGKFADRRSRQVAENGSVSTVGLVRDQ
jgi:hypothetical protein